MFSFLFIKFFIWITFIIAPVNPGLHITITGLKSNEGKVILGIYKNEGGFPVIGKQFKGFDLKIKNNHANVTVKDLAKGTYAIGVCHDLNGNGKLDKNFLGIPTEPYGFSQNVRAYLTNPKFDEASFYFDGSKEIAIKVDYY